MNYARHSYAWLWLGLTAFGSAAAVHADAQTAAPKWEYVEDDDHVRLWKLEVPGQDLPGFRGQTIIDASIDDILSVMLQWQKHTDWMYRCAESKLLKELNNHEALMYNRTSAPWPVWDRDVIVSTDIQRGADNKSVSVTFKNVASDLKPVPGSTIRMPRLEGFYKLWYVGPKQTRVMYQVESDIGGSIPKWLAARATKDLPRITLVKLKERVTGKPD
ncbi:MAG: Collagenase [Myxococcaceae bacterium]|nr:Collagenase [Myxococcaceae bacterium]